MRKLTFALTVTVLAALSACAITPPKATAPAAHRPIRYGQSGGSEVGSFPNAAALNGSERILADQTGVTVNLTPTQIATFLGVTPGTIVSFTGAITAGHCGEWSATGILEDSGAACGGGGSSAFSSLTSGTNTSAAMLVGTGASLGYTGSGILDANEILGLTFPSLVASDCLTNNGSVLSWGSCGTGSGITLSTNGTNNSSQTALNIENGQGITCSNPSSGNVQCVTTQPNRTVTGTTDAVSCTSDAGGVILYNSSSAVAVSVPQATSTCGSGFGFTVENSGAGTATLTPTTSTIQGLSSLAIPTNSGCSLWSDGTNYQVASCRALETLTYAEGSVTTVTPNCAFGTTTATITGAATIDTPTGCTPYNGQRIFLEIQSASSETYTASGYITGSTTGAWPASSTGSSKDDHFELIYDGYLSSPGWTLAAYNLGL